MLLLGAAFFAVALLQAGPAPAGSSSAVPGPARWVAAARTGSPLELVLGDRRVEVSVHRTDVLSRAVRAGMARSGITVETLGVTVVGSDDSAGRVTVTKDWVAGWIRDGSTTWELSPPAGSRARIPVPTGRVIDVDPSDTGAGDSHTLPFVGCLSVAPHLTSSPGGLMAGWSPIRIDVAVSTDNSYVRANGADWQADAAAVVNAADGIYAPLALSLRLVSLHQDDFTSTDSSALIEEARVHYRDYHGGSARHLAAVMVARPIGPVGQARCIGGAGDDVRGYLVMDTRLSPVGVGPIEFYSNGQAKTLAHEIGHLLNAHHHYSNCAEGSRQPLPDTCTLMTPYLELLDERIGSFEALVMRGWAEENIR